MWVFFLPKCVKRPALCILQEYPWTDVDALRRLYKQVGLGGWVYAITKYDPASFFVLSDFTHSSIDMVLSCRHTGFWIMLPCPFVIIFTNYNNLHLTDCNNN